jgi:hypothetical protein
VPHAAASPLEVVRAVVVAQAVFTVGNVLTTGGFLSYFAYGLHPSAFALSILFVTPEVCETLALASRGVIRRFGSRKRTWLVCFVLARVAALGIPAVALVDLPAGLAYGCLIGSLGLSHALQSIGYTAYISWLSDLVPNGAWGRFFALRRIANVAVLVLLPAGAALLRRDWTSWVTDAAVRQGYSAIFLTGNVLMWLTIIPLLRLPDIPVQWQAPAGWRGSVKTAVSTPSLRLITTSTIWLAAAQGLTQAVFFSYQVKVLQLPLEASLALTSLMYLVQLPLSWLGGWLSDQVGDRRPLMSGLLLVSGAMAFWLLARPSEPYWLVGAYLTWGLFGLVNVCQRNLLLRTAPPSDNAAPLAVLEHLAGLFAGIAGLVGGAALDYFQTRSGGSASLWPYALLFVLSWLGRATAAAWLWPVREPARSSIS